MAGAAKGVKAVQAREAQANTKKPPRNESVFASLRDGAYVSAFAADIKIKTSLPPGDVPFNVWSPVGAQAAYKLSTAPRPATGVTYKPPNAHRWTPPAERAPGLAPPRAAANGGVEVPGPVRWSHAEQLRQWRQRVQAEDREASLAELQFAARDASAAATAAGLAFGSSSSVRGSAPGVAADFALPSPAAVGEQQRAFRAATARLLSGEAAAHTRAARYSFGGSFGGSLSGSGSAGDGSAAEAAAAAPLAASSAAAPANLSALALALTGPRPATTTAANHSSSRTSARPGSVPAPSPTTLANGPATSFAAGEFFPVATEAPPCSAPSSQGNDGARSASLARRGLTAAQAASLAVAPLLGGGALDDLKPRAKKNHLQRLVDAPGNRPSCDSAAMRRVLVPSISNGGPMGSATRPPRPWPASADRRSGALDGPAPLPAHLVALQREVARRRLQRDEAAAQNSGLARAVAARQAATARAERAFAEAGDARAKPLSAARTGAVGTVGVLSRMTLTSEQMNERPTGSVRKMWF